MPVENLVFLLMAVPYIHWASWGADKGTWAEHREGPAGKGSLESHWIKAGACHLPLDYFIFNRHKTGRHTNTAHSTEPPCIVSPPLSYSRQPRQLFQVMQVHQSNQDLYSTTSTTSVALLGWVFCSPTHIWEISKQKLYLSWVIN